MPMPTPRKGEKDSDFTSRCMSNEKMMMDFPDNKQRLAVCYNMFEDKNSKKKEEK